MDEFTRCQVCTRTPLVGEEVTVMRRGRREAIVCDQCISAPRVTTLGEAVGHERIRSAEGAANVERVFPRPVASPSSRPARRVGTAA